MSATTSAQSISFGKELMDCLSVTCTKAKTGSLIVGRHLALTLSDITQITQDGMEKFLKLALAISKFATRFLDASLGGFIKYMGELKDIIYATKIFGSIKELTSPEFQKKESIDRKGIVLLAIANFLDTCGYLSKHGVVKFSSLAKLGEQIGNIKVHGGARIGHATSSAISVHTCIKDIPVIGRLISKEIFVLAHAALEVYKTARDLYWGHLAASIDKSLKISVTEWIGACLKLTATMGKIALITLADTSLVKTGGYLILDLTTQIAAFSKFDMDGEIKREAQRTAAKSIEKERKAKGTGLRLDDMVAKFREDNKFPAGHGASAA